MTTAELERLAEELGIDAIGAAPAEPYEETERHIRERREQGLFADMRFTMARPEVSCHPESLLPGARTVISAALCYYAPETDREPGEGRLPRYTWFDAYAELRERLDSLGRMLGGEYRVLVDENDHVDREAAARSGVGFYGKNTMLITRRHGSWVVLGTLVTEAELETTPRLPLDCGSCTLCIEACPTGALDDPGTLDSTRCLSYWSQAPGEIPEEYRAEMGAQVYGCDICQDVCPWNRGIEKRRADEPMSRGRRASRLARRVARAVRRRAPRAIRAALLPPEGPAVPAAKRHRRRGKLRQLRAPPAGRGVRGRRRSASARARRVGADAAGRGALIVDGGPRDRGAAPRHGRAHRLARQPSRG